MQEWMINFWSWSNRNKTLTTDFDQELIWSNNIYDRWLMMNWDDQRTDLIINSNNRLDHNRDDQEVIDQEQWIMIDCDDDDWFSNQSHARTQTIDFDQELRWSKNIDQEPRWSSMWLIL